MAKRFTRNIRSIENIEKQPKYTNEQNDLLSDDKHVYIRNKDKYENLTNSVKSVNGKEPDEQGNIKVDNIEQIEKAADQAKDDIQTSVSDVQSRQAGAEKDISGIVESTERARDEAVKTMNELDYSDRNLLVSDNLISYKNYNEFPVVEENGRKITTKFVSSNVTLRDKDLKPDGKYTLSGRMEINGKPITRGTISGQVINTKHDDSQNERLEVLSDGSFIVTETYDSETDNSWIIHAHLDGIEPGDVITFYDLQFQPGSVATPWQPAFGDYDAKIKKLEQAITNLGGEI